MQHGIIAMHMQFIAPQLGETSQAAKQGQMRVATQSVNARARALSQDCRHARHDEAPATGSADHTDRTRRPARQQKIHEGVSMACGDALIGSAQQSKTPSCHSAVHCAPLSVFDSLVCGGGARRRSARVWRGKGQTTHPNNTHISATQPGARNGGGGGGRSACSPWTPSAKRSRT